MTVLVVDAGTDADALLVLMRRAFAQLEGRIDPPSSLSRLTRENLLREDLALIAIGAPPVACAVLTPQDDALYIGKIAVDPDLQRQGLGREILTFAERFAQAQGLDRVRLRSRIELAENHAFFRGCGFEQTAQMCHPGYGRPTSLTFEKRL